MSRSANWADEAFVVDSRSTDRTISIAEQEGAKVVQFDYQGVAKKEKLGSRQLAFQKRLGSHPRCRRMLASRSTGGNQEDHRNSDATHSGYWINRRYFFMGKPLKHAYFPNWNLRLFKLGRQVRKITEGNTDSGDHEIHEHVVVKGTTGKLKAIMDHHAFPTIESFVEKHNRYSNWEAVVESTAKDKAGSLQHKGVKGKRLLRRIFRILPFRPTLRFLYVYLWQGGILDGWPGYVFARLHGQYEFLTVIKARERSTGREKSR